MRDLLVAVSAVSLSLILSINAMKKEDLEKAAELAVERAAERVAERAVEKALEAGNSSTTTITVKEGYSNARKVAEEQAAPGSESTRPEPEYSNEYSEEYVPQSAEVEQNNRNESGEEIQDEGAVEPQINRTVNYEDDADFNWNIENSPFSGNFGMKESKQPNLKYKNPAYRNNRPTVKKPEEDYYDDDDEIDQDYEAWKSFSNWDKSFKKDKNDRWSPSRSFWSGEDFSGNDSLFWDMEDAETKDDVEEEREEIVADPETRGTDQSWKGISNYPLQKDFFSWGLRGGHLPIATEINEKDTKKGVSAEQPYHYAFPKVPFWKKKEYHQNDPQRNEEVPEIDSWTNRKNSKEILEEKKEVHRPRSFVPSWQKDNHVAKASQNVEVKIEAPYGIKMRNNNNRRRYMLENQYQSVRRRNKITDNFSSIKKLPTEHYVLLPTNFGHDHYLSHPLPTKSKVDKVERKKTYPISASMKQLYTMSIAKSTPVDMKPPHPINMMKPYTTLTDYSVNKSYPSHNSKSYSKQKLKYSSRY